MAKEEGKCEKLNKNNSRSGSNSSQQLQQQPTTHEEKIKKEGKTAMNERTMKNKNVINLQHRKIMRRDQCRVFIPNSKGSWRAVGGKQNKDNWSRYKTR